ncbi:MAG: AAC(3) family N-acetyltransferase [Tannerella sp.]|jgi:aminoglycoside N3'-acetyltransferase|nr:AAC(3) family N-acetyltransferase [Tannerella sp.]
MIIDYLNIAKQLSLQSNDVLLIAGDVTSLALHEAALGKKFNANAFIQSFKEQLSTGTLLFHAFTDTLTSGDTFDYQKSKPNTGALSVAAWKDPSFRRTSDPFHSFMVWGKESAAFKEKDDPSTFGGHSVFARLHQHKAKMLIIDLPLVKSFTFVHYCEEQLKVPYRTHIKHLITYIDEAAVVTIHERFFFTRKSGYSNYLDELEKRLIEHGIIQTFSFNDAGFMLVDLPQVYHFIASHLYPHGNLKLFTFSIKDWLKDEIRKMIKRRSTS